MTSEPLRTGMSALRYGGSVKMHSNVAYRRFPSRRQLNRKEKKDARHQEGFVSVGAVWLLNGAGTWEESPGAIWVRHLCSSMAMPAMAMLQQALMRVIIFAGFFLSESW